jgi:uncharacterized protein (DUF1800 family)
MRLGIIAGILCACLTGALGAKPEVEFFSDSISLTAGKSAVIPAQLSQPVDEATDWKVQAPPGDSIHILQPLKALPAYPYAYMRVLAEKPGEYTLRLEGGSSVRLTVHEADTTGGGLMSWVAPIEGAILNGTVTVGIDQQIANPRDRRWNKNLPVLKIQGQKFKPTKVLEEGLPAYVRFVYQIDTRSLSPGWTTLEARRPGPDGADAITRSVIISEEANGGAVYFAEAETGCEVLFQPDNTNRSYSAAKIKEDDKASAGSYAFLPGGNHTVSYRIEIPENGYYQVMARARGSWAVGSLPSVSLFKGNNDNPLTCSRIVDSEWHRVPIGKPIRLDAGEELITLRFYNPQNAKKKKRHLELDTFELVTISNQTPPISPRESQLKVAFSHIFDGQLMTGPMKVQGLSRHASSDKETSRPPRVELWVNNKRIESQYATRPEFMLHPAHLKSGSNRIQLRAHHRGRTVSTPHQEIVYHPPKVEPSQVIETYTFTARDPAWGEKARRLVQKYNKHNLPYAIHMYQEGEVKLRLPAGLPGDHQLSITTVGEPYQGLPRASFTLEKNGESYPLSSIKCEGYKKTYAIGTVDLEDADEAYLTISYDNDSAHKNPKKGDRNLVIGAVQLASAKQAPEDDPPRLVVHYPASGQTMWKEDVIVAEVFDISGIQSARVVINGNVSNLTYRPGPASGYLVMPLKLNGLLSGSHRVALQVIDHQGNRETSDPIDIRIAHKKPEKPGAYHRAVALLDRLAYGPEPQALAEILVSGEDQWLNDALGAGRLSIGERHALARSEIQHTNINSYTVARCALDFGLYTNEPVRFRFNMFIQNHFSTWIRKCGADEKWSEHLAFSSAGFQTFDELLNISARSAAMLVYLDQQRSFAKRINENYAREIMELHTLSVGGHYAQEDVTHLSRVLTGWMTATESYPDGRGNNRRLNQFRFEEALNDPAPARVIGLQLPEATNAEAAYDRIRFFLEALSRHPDTARFISRKMVQHYTTYPGSPELVDTLTQVYHRTGGDTRQMMLAMVKHPHFWDATGEKRLSTPLDYCLRAARAVDYPNAGTLHSFLNRSGMGLFEKSTPDGYPEEPQAYADSNAMLQRWHLAKDISWRLFHHINTHWKVEGGWKKHPEALLELTQLTLTGETQTEAKRKIARNFIRKVDDDLWEPGLCALVMQFPESHFR